MRFNLAILSVLAARPHQRIAMEDVRREVRTMIAAGDEAKLLTRSSELGDADVFESGWVSINDAGFQITPAGLSLWRSLEATRIEQEHNAEKADQMEANAAESHGAGAPAAIDLPSDVDLDASGPAGEAASDHATSGSSRSIHAPDAGLLNVPAFPGPAFGSVQRANRDDLRLSALLKSIRASMPRMARARRRRSAKTYRNKARKPPANEWLGLPSHASL